MSTISAAPTSETCSSLTLASIFARCLKIRSLHYFCLMNVATASYFGSLLCHFLSLYFTKRQEVIEDPYPFELFLCHLPPRPFILTDYCFSLDFTSNFPKISSVVNHSCFHLDQLFLWLNFKLLMLVQPFCSFF